MVLILLCSDTQFNELVPLVLCGCCLCCYWRWAGLTGPTWARLSSSAEHCVWRPFKSSTAAQPRLLLPRWHIAVAAPYATLSSVGARWHCWSHWSEVDRRVTPRGLKFMSCLEPSVTNQLCVLPWDTRRKVWCKVSKQVLGISSTPTTHDWI